MAMEERGLGNDDDWVPSSPTPSGKRRLIIGSSVVGGALLLVGIGAVGNGGDTSTPSTVTVTATVTVQPSTVTRTAEPVTSTVTVTESAAPTPAVEAPTTTEPQAVETAAPVPAETPSSVYYRNCAAARAAGAAPLYRGQPGYRSALDRDDDGIACE